MGYHFPQFPAGISPFPEPANTPCPARVLRRSAWCCRLSSRHPEGGERRPGQAGCRLSLHGSHYGAFTMTVDSVASRRVAFPWGKRRPAALIPVYTNCENALPAPGRFRSIGWSRGILGTFGGVLGELIVQNYIDQRLVNPDAAVVFDEAELAKAIHEEADAGAGGADHLDRK